jgi:hypothetical protein
MSEVDSKGRHLKQMQVQHTLRRRRSNLTRGCATAMGLMLGAAAARVAATAAAAVFGGSGASRGGGEESCDLMSAFESTSLLLLLLLRLLRGCAGWLVGRTPLSAR